MNLKQINEWRTAHGLAPIVPAANTANKRQAANQAARASVCRALKDIRNKRSK